VEGRTRNWFTHSSNPVPSFARSDHSSLHGLLFYPDDGVAGSSKILVSIYMTMCHLIPQKIVILIVQGFSMLDIEWQQKL
jgi:hypothetical protein